MLDNSKTKPNSKKEKENKENPPPPVKWAAPKSCLSEWSSYKEAKIKITTTKKTEQRELQVGNSGRRTLSSMWPSLGTPSLHGWIEESSLWSGPSTQDQAENELELNQLWRPWAVVGRQPVIRGVCHVTPSGNGKSWRGAAGSGSSAGLWPGSRGHWEARAMVRATEARASSAAAPTMLGTAVVRAAFLESLHQSHTGLQKAQSPSISGNSSALQARSVPQLAAHPCHNFGSMPCGGPLWGTL